MNSIKSQSSFRSGDLSLKIEGEVVPIVDVQLGQQQSVYFEHHILLWKQPNVRLGMKGLKGAVKRYFAGLVLIHGYGNVFEKYLAPGEMLDVEPGAWLWKDSSVRMETVTALQSSGGLLGAVGVMLGGISFTLNRFIGPGRLGLQSMTYHPPAPEGATQVGGDPNLR